MRLVSFRVKKYRSIEDSGEIRVDDNVTTLVGINESGKTNVMRALRKINSVRDTKFEDLTEHPTWHFGDVNPSEIFVTATFKLDDSEKEHIEEICDSDSPGEVTFSRSKNMTLYSHLEPIDPLPFASFEKNYLQPIRDVLNKSDIPSGGGAQSSLIPAFDLIGKGLQPNVNVRTPQFLPNIKSAVGSFKAVIPAEHPKRGEVCSLLDKINEITEDCTEKVNAYLFERLPRFIYFENTGIIDSRIYLPTFVQKLDAGGLDEDELTAKTLLDLGKLDPHKILKWSEEDEDSPQARQNKNRLEQTLSLASKKVSEEIDEIWSSNNHNIEFSVHGPHLQVWVKNKHDGLKLQLEERSRGYQWYFSFYTIFNVESKQRHKDAIILLDEPALFLHAKGQDDFLNKTLPKLGEKNQIIYTTHSPSMIDLSRPRSIHTVVLKDEVVNGSTQKVSRISNEVWDSDRDALFPLQAALHYTMAQSMFIGKKNLVVEGITDYWLLNSASALLEAAGKAHLKDDFAFVPAGGGTKSILLATMYKSQDLDVAVLLDADREGENAQNQIVKSKILGKKKVLLINEIFGETKNMSIEDVFPEEYYLKFVQSAYEKELGGKGITDINLTSRDPMIVNRITEFFKSNDLGKFNKSRPDKEILNELGRADIGDLPAELVGRLETMFGKINKML